MTMRRSSRAWMLAVLLAGGLAVGGSVALAGATYRVSQKGRAFDPPHLTIARGDTVAVQNDDAGLLHHVYIEADGFTFDSGEQKSGEIVAVSFPKRGRFDVLCGIHPKMRLIVDVR